MPGRGEEQQAVRLLGIRHNTRHSSQPPLSSTRKRQVALPEVATASARRSALLAFWEFSTLFALFIIIANFHIIMRGRIQRQAARQAVISSSSSPPACPTLPLRQLVAIATFVQFQFRWVELSWVIYLSSAAQTINIKVNYSLCLCENPYVINVCSEIFGLPFFAGLLLRPACALFLSLSHTVSVSVSVSLCALKWHINICCCCRCCLNLLDYIKC